MPRPRIRLDLVPMSRVERKAFLNRQAREYGEAKARAGFWTEDVAEPRARAEIEGLLGSHPDEAGHRLLNAVDGAGRVVGWLWTGPPPGGTLAHHAWIYDIEIDEPLRGRGLGRALLIAAEEAVREQGCPEVRLNVFAWNRVAVSLYESSGYEVASRYETGMEMRKRLPPTR